MTDGGYTCGCHGVEHQDGCPECEAGTPCHLDPECPGYREVGTVRGVVRPLSKRENAAVKKLLGGPLRCSS